VLEKFSLVYLFIYLFIYLFTCILFSKLRAEILNLYRPLNCPRKMGVINDFKSELSYHDKIADINLVYLI
jgi:hypothetical protein